MSSVAALASQNSSLAYVEHEPGSADTWQLIYSSACTSNGAADGTTVVDTTRDSGGANTYSGRYWVHITSGACKGAWRRIVDDDGAGTLTVEEDKDDVGFQSQIVDTVTYELWKSPEPVIVVDSSSGATNIVDAVRDEADDFWIGYWVVMIHGNKKGQKAQVTDFVSSTGTFTVGSGFAASLSAGDVLVLRKYIDVSSISNGLSQEFNARPVNRLDGAKCDGSVGVKGGTFGFEMVALGVHQVSAGNVVRSVMGGLLVACGFKEVTSGSLGGEALIAGSTTTQLEVNAADWENFSIGALLSVEGEQAFITALTDDTNDNITITPPLGVAPDFSAVIARSVNYRRNRRNSDGDYGAVTLVLEVDGVRTTMTGCKGNVTVSGESELMFSYEFSVDHWIREWCPSEEYQGDAYPTYAPIQATQRRCYFGSTAVELGGISASLNNTVAAKKVQGSTGINGRAGFAHSAVNPGLTCRKIQPVVAGSYNDADDRWYARTSHDLMVFWGTTVYGGCAIRMPVSRLVAEPKPEDDEGMQVTPFVFESMDAGTQSDPDSVVQKIPDFTISFC